MFSINSEQNIQYASTYFCADLLRSHSISKMTVLQIIRSQRSEKLWRNRRSSNAIIESSIEIFNERFLCREEGFL